MLLLRRVGLWEIISIISLISAACRVFSVSYKHTRNPYIIDSVRQHRLYSAAAASLSNSNPDDRGGPSFDADFAEAMSKPLPKWYEDAELEREKLLQELESNRERIVKEFKSKYEISEEQKRAEIDKRTDRYKQRISTKNSAGSKGKQQSGFFGRLFGSSSVVDDQEARTETMEDMETVTDVDVSSKEKWEAFWKEEEEQTGFSLPGFFEVFPELKIRWPTWARRKDGSALECERDQDCPFPLACCPHPIIPGQKFCCSGWGQRVLVKAYQPQEIVSEAMVNRGRKSDDEPERESWRPN